MPVLSADNLHVWRGEAHVLRGVSFEISEGTCLQVTGANGSGKTTLLRTLCGLVLREEGSIRWGGRDTGETSGDFHRSLFYLAHDVPLKADLTGRENLRYTVGLRRRGFEARIGDALERAGAAHFTDRPARTLSAGQRRRLGLAMLLLTEVPLWILDEPLTNLDARGQALVGELIGEQLARRGTVVAAVHQDLKVPSDRLARLELAAA